MPICGGVRLRPESLAPCAASATHCAPGLTPVVDNMREPQPRGIGILAHWRYSRLKERRLSVPQRGRNAHSTLPRSIRIRGVRLGPAY